jgi:hypothetical protein
MDRIGKHAETEPRDASGGDTVKGKLRRMTGSSCAKRPLWPSIRRRLDGAALDRVLLDACELIKEDSGQWRFSRRTVFHDHDYTLDGIARKLRGASGGLSRRLRSRQQGLEARQRPILIL